MPGVVQVCTHVWWVDGVVRVAWASAVLLPSAWLV